LPGPSTDRGPELGAATDLRQSWPLPSRPRPIVIIGAGGIVRTAHLPTYHRLKFPVAGLFDTNPRAAEDTARRFAVPKIFADLDEASQFPGAVFDVAVPGDQIHGVLQHLPPGAAVLMQKPMGEHLASARRILAVCCERRLAAALNFQLRFSPNVLALRDLLARGNLGEIVDIEVRLAVKQPWQQWSFLEGAPRLEILYHSIHYLDLIRALAGEPRGAYCRAVAHPALPQFRDTRSTTILDYGGRLRCSLMMNHTHDHNAAHRESMFKVEGTRGAAILTMGVNLDYPDGGPDRLEVALEKGPWESVPLRGAWFTEAFEGPMSNLQRYIAGEDQSLVSPVDDAILTMALVEACYESSAAGGTPVPEVG
jgi:predicted dehydrogenase